MSYKDPINYNLLGWAWFILIAIFGATAKYASEVLAGKHEFTWGRLALSMLVAAFAGWLGGVACLESGLSSNLQLITAGLSGYGLFF